MELLDEPETGAALSLALSIDSEGLVLDLEARFVISSGLDKDMPSMGSRFEELEFEGVSRSGAAELDIGCPSAKLNIV